MAYACGPLLHDSVALLLAMVDRWTGLPYDQLPCGGQWANSATGTNRAWGVVPQLAYAQVTTFAEDPGKLSETVGWSFVDRGPDGADPDLLFALKVQLALTSPGDSGQANTFGGLLWHANADVSRYKTLRIRYSTSGPGDAWELKLNSGSTTIVEPTVALPATAPGAWNEASFDIVGDFAGTNRTQLNYITLSTSLDKGGTAPVLWVDQISFVADLAQTATCTVACDGDGGPPPTYPDLSCYEPMTGAVNIANELSILSLAPSAGLLDATVGKTMVERALTTLETVPGANATTRANGSAWSGGGWFQDWHSPTSGMPDPRNHVASLTDQPQLYAALMVVEKSWPDLASRAAALRAKMDFAVLYDDSGGCPGILYGAIDRCTGVRRDWRVEYYGNDSLLGAFLAVASGGAPGCFWADGLANKGCALDGPANGPWLTTGRFCMNAAIPASDTGGPFLQLAALTYLKGDTIPVGSQTLAASAENMLRAQLDFAPDAGLALAGWANASDPNACAYMTCDTFSSANVTPYISAMGLSLLPTSAAKTLLAFHAAGVDALLNTGSRDHAFGLRDSWDQQSARARDAYLYLDSGWSVLGLLNACNEGQVRQRFGEHAVAQAGYTAAQAHPANCKDD